ncbi:MAG: hypothetical protein GXY91_00610 [Clostridia bacterium]|nr:hypothetical protein [Clostridia bacterium]
MNSLAAKYLAPNRRKKALMKQNNVNDLFAASVINQKAVNQTAQQALVLIAVQATAIVEAQFGFATNEDNDDINV